MTITISPAPLELALPADYGRLFTAEQLEAVAGVAALVTHAMVPTLAEVAHKVAVQTTAVALNAALPGLATRAELTAIAQAAAQAATIPIDTLRDAIAAAMSSTVGSNDVRIDFTRDGAGRIVGATKATR